MTGKIRKYFRPRTVFATVVSLLLAAVMMQTTFLYEAQRQAVSDFSEGWTDDTGSRVDLDKVDTKNYDDHTVVLTKKLPAQIAYDDALCLIGANAVLQVSIDGAPVYSYEQKPNLSGYGYGVAYHFISLCPEQAGKTVQIELGPVFQDGHGAHLRMVSVESASAYRSRLVKGQLLPFFVSVGIVTIGVLMLFSAIMLPRWKRKLSLFSLSVFAVATGIWLVNDTGLFRLMVDGVIFSRTVDYVFMHMWVLPLNVFIYSITKERRKSFLYVSALMVLVDIGFFLTMRFAFGRDMSALTPILVLYYLCEFCLVGWTLYRDSVYCRSYKIPNNLRFFYTGFSVMISCTLIDLAIYLAGVRSVTGRGAFVRVGFCVFFAMMSLLVVQVLSGERASVRRDRFINKMLLYAASDRDPEVSIRAIIEYFGRQYGADHAYLFENRQDGTFHNTYEWFREDAPEPGSRDYADIPFEGLIDRFYEVFRSEHRLIVEANEQTRQRNPMLYSFMKRMEISRMVVSPLEQNGELIGLFGVDDAPAEKNGEIADVIWLTAYFLSGLLVRRNEKRDLLRSSYTDSLTGAKNRRALVEYEVGCGEIAPYGFVMCDINGLKIENDTHGHEAGDAMIIDVAESLMDAFGRNQVYRIGGDEFAAYAPKTSRDDFEKMVQRARMLVAAKGRSASFGAVHTMNDPDNRTKVREQADSLMYQEKEAYYRGRNDRRSGRS